MNLAGIIESYQVWNGEHTGLQVEQDYTLKISMELSVNFYQWYKLPPTDDSIKEVGSMPFY